MAYNQNQNYNKRPNPNRHQINRQIRDREVRVIDADGSQLGIMNSYKANELAEEKGLDLVKISPNSVPPVCKIMDYGKFKFEQVKKEKEAKKNQKIIDMKEMRLSMNIDDNDLNTKANQSKKFLENGDKVKVSLKMRGRQNAHSKLGIDVMNSFYDILKDMCVMEKNPTLDGKNILMILAPNKSAPSK